MQIILVHYTGLCKIVACYSGQGKLPSITVLLLCLYNRVRLVLCVLAMENVIFCKS
jgi:hypothetical protein